MRVDKMTLAALEATLRSYEAGLDEDVPVIAMLSADKTALEAKALQLCARIREAGVFCELTATESRVGGGSVPGQAIPSFAAAIEGCADALEERLRKRDIPIIGRIHEGRYLLDVRTLRDEDFPIIAEALKEAMA